MFVLAWLLVLANAGAGLPADAREFLTTRLRFSARDFAALEAGRPVGKSLPSTMPGELVLGGAIRLRTSRRDYLRWYRDPRNWTLTTQGNRPAILDARLLSTPPSPEDFAALTLEPADRDAARACRSGACGIKAAPALIEAFQKPGASPDQALRQAWLALARDAAKPDHLLFWTRERYGYGLKITAALYHATVAEQGGHTSLITTTLLAATHYFDDSLGLTLVADLPDGGAVLAYVNRARVDALRQGWGARFRWIIDSAAPRAARRELMALAARVEAWRALRRPPPPPLP